MSLNEELMRMNLVQSGFSVEQHVEASAPHVIMTDQGMFLGMTNGDPYHLELQSSPPSSYRGVERVTRDVFPSVAQAAMNTYGFSGVSLR